MWHPQYRWIVGSLNSAKGLRQHLLGQGSDAPQFSEIPGSAERNPSTRCIPVPTNIIVYRFVDEHIGRVVGCQLLEVGVSWLDGVISFRADYWIRINEILLCRDL